MCWVPSSPSTERHQHDEQGIRRAAGSKRADRTMNRRRCDQLADGKRDRVVGPPHAIADGPLPAGFPSQWPLPAPDDRQRSDARYEEYAAVVEAWTLQSRI